jgi:hypothetical protein
MSINRFGLGLFDVCPTRGKVGCRTDAGWQTLNKPKPLLPLALTLE